MILIEPSHPLVTTFLDKYAADPEERLEDCVVAGDYDGTRYVMLVQGQTPESVLEVHMSMVGYDSFVKLGAKEYLSATFGSHLTAGQTGFHFAVRLPEKTFLENAKEWTRKLASLKSGIFQAALEHCLKQNAEVSSLVPLLHNESVLFYVKPSSSTRLVVFQLALEAGADDSVLAASFLRELQDARRDPKLQTAPQCMFFAEKLPPEIAHLAKTHKELVEGKGVAYVVFSLQDRHVTAASLKKTGELLGNFRAYLAYHMKCCKAYLHFRMRDKVATWLQVLNRTKRESLEEKKKKTITGRTFTRK